MAKVELSELLRFDPGWIKDPVPWPFLIPHLDKQQIFEAARIHLEYQKAVQAAYTKALGQFENVLKGVAR
jgi:hypothetical protein